MVGTQCLMMKMTVMMVMVMMVIVDEETEVQKEEVTSPSNIASWW